VLTRRDLIHSQQFLRRRLLTALVAQRPDPLQWSGTRLAGATLVAVMVLVIAVASVGIYGFVRPAGNKQWKACDRVIIESESGAPYVCGDGVLYPAVNFASAALLRGLAQEPIRVARASLTWPRGPVVGIPGAPNVLPRPDELLTAAWSFCVRAPRTTTTRPQTVLFVGQSSPGTARGLGADEAIAVTDAATRQLTIIIQGVRHEVRDPSVVSQALRVNTTDTIPVTAAWLATFPFGTVLDKLNVAGRGGPVERLAQVKVGQLVAVDDGGRTQHFVGRPNGLQPVSELQEALIRATANDTTAPVKLDVRQLAGVTRLEPLSEQVIGDGRVPAMVPVSRSQGAVCGVVSDATDHRNVVVGIDVPSGDATSSLPAVGPRASMAGALLADGVVVAPGRGALVRALPTPTAGDGPVYLVTETGWRHAIGTSNALERLGYAGVTAMRLPSTVVERLAQGPVLSELTLVTPVR
jgi:type VII secretion protein EccB